MAAPDALAALTARREAALAREHGVTALATVDAIPGWPEAARALASGLPPGENLAFVLRTAGEPLAAPALAAGMEAAGLGLLAVVPFGLLDANPALVRWAGGAHDEAIAATRAALAAPGAAELWTYLEEALGPLLPPTVAGRCLIVAEPGGKTAWRPWAWPGRVDAASFAAALGARYPAFQADLAIFLAPRGAAELVAVLDGVFGRHLPHPIDYLEVLRHQDRVRVLDQVAWRWARQLGDLTAAEIQSPDGEPLVALQHYELLVNFVAYLKPLAGGTRP